MLENQQAGSPGWKVTNPADDTTMQIKGFGSATSINKGESISFHVTVTPAQSFSIEVYRMGWYNGDGGRLMSQIGPIAGIQQPNVTVDTNTGMVVTPWAASHTLTVPTTWTSGVYMAKLINAAGYENHIPFVVRDDARTADFLYQQSVTTDQAYNNFPDDGATGKSLYNYNSYGAGTPDLGGARRSAKVSFDRPYSGDGSGLFFRWEHHTIRWLEKMGYDVTYSTNIDTHQKGATLLNYKAFLSTGHDEYWSTAMRNAVEQARDGGVNLAFFGSNVSYYQVRFEDSANGNPDRVMTCYKDADLDPEPNENLKTILFKDLGRTEQTLVGVRANAFNSPSNNTDYVVYNTSHWAYANTGFNDGDKVLGIIGYEVDGYNPAYPMPDNVSHTFLSASPFLDQSGLEVISLSSIYQAPSLAWVFATGTMSWSWGLDRNGYIDTRLQKMTKNILDKFQNGLDGPPAISLAFPSNQANLIGDTVALPMTVTNPNNRPLTYSATNLPVGLSIDPNTGLISGITDTITDNISTVIVNDDLGNSDTESFFWVVTPPPVITCDNPILEAESALLNGGFTIQNDASASSGQYIEVLNNTDSNDDINSINTATFCFRVTQAGTYRIKGPTWSPNGGSNSFFVTIDGTPTHGFVWGTPLSNNFVSDYIGDRNGADPIEVYFGTGDHIVIIYNREDGTRLDFLELELVEADNSDPMITLTNPGDQSNLVGDVVSLQVNVTNLGNRPLTFTASGLPTGLNINSSNGLVTGIANATTANMVSITVADDLGNSLNEIFNWTISEPPTITCGGPFLEAENALLSGVFTFVSDSTASGGQYIEVPNNSGVSSDFGNINTATFCFSVSQAGTYRIEGLTWSPNGGSNSFFVAIDGQPPNGYIWATPLSNTFISDYIGNRNGDDPVEVNLSVGDHTVIIYNREDGTRLDWLRLELINGDPQNQAPSLTNPGAQTNIINDAINFALAATDPENDPLVFSVIGLPTGLTLNSNSGEISGVASTTGGFTVTASVSDGNNNSDEVSFSWQVVNLPPPVAITQNITLQLDSAGNTTITPANVDGGSTVSIGSPNLSLNRTTFTCADIGQNTVTLTVEDGNGQISSSTATVTVEDTVPPTVIAQNLSVQLDGEGTLVVITITPNQIDNGSSDACGVATRTLDQDTFTEPGDYPVVLTVTDVNGNVATANAIVTVSAIDTSSPPVVVTQNVTLQLDSNGNAILTPEDVNGGSTIFIGDPILSLNRTTFTCADVGPNMVTLTVEDSNGLTSSGTATVTVEDTVPPTVIAQNASIQLNNGDGATVTPAQIDTGSNDACGIMTRVIDQSTFTEPGDYPVVLTITDVNGNVATANAIVTVSEAPNTLSSLIYISASVNGSVDNINFSRDDILVYDLDNQSWSIIFDASDVGLLDLNAFTFRDEGSPLPAIYISTATDQALPNVGEINNHDIVKFTPTSLGEVTSGTFSSYKVGLPLGLNTNGETISAIAFAPDGRLLISVDGNFNAPGTSGRDEDLYVLNTDNSWGLYFDGSDVRMANNVEELWGGWIHPLDGRLFLTTRGNFVVDGLSGSGADIFICDAITLGSSTACIFSPFWSGSDHGFNAGSIDGLSLWNIPATSNQSQLVLPRERRLFLPEIAKLSIR